MMWIWRYEEQTLTWGYGAAEEGGPEIEGDTREPDDEHTEGDALGAVLEYLERVLTDFLR